MLSNVFLSIIIITFTVASELPTLYEYYTADGIQNGLSANQPYFTLNNKNITLYSGAMHYFRVPKAYWRDRLRKMRAAGLNAVETYVAWNLHEPESGKFDFGNGGSDWEEFLDIKEFLQIAQEEDLFAIVRSGPFICSEWEFGGLPSWLLRNQGIQVRTADETYIAYVWRYFNVLLPILNPLQFTKGGPVIAFQVENEYGSTASDSFTPDKNYLEELREILINNGIVELLVTSDGASSGTRGTLPDKFLMTANFGPSSDPTSNFETLKKYQKDKPSMSMEFWGGWFDHWSESHHTVSVASFESSYEKILAYNASVNIYMFHGGTSYGFMNGANLASFKTDNSDFQPDTTSYDYDAVLSENGDYTPKYQVVKSLLQKYNKIKTKLPEEPQVTNSTAYETLQITEQMSLSSLIKQTNISYVSDNVIPMEQLPVNNNSGQSYGYIVYRKVLNISENSQLKISGHVCDTVTVLVNGVLISKPLRVSSDLDKFGFWRLKDSTIKLSNVNLTNAVLDLLVENWGRGNFGSIPNFNQHKGLWQGSIFLDGEELHDWTIVPLEFKKSWTRSLTSWQKFTPNVLGPHLYKTVLRVKEPIDTFVDLEDWTKGIVVINGFVLGRYSRIGPQQTLYLPGPFLKEGDNELLIFEHYNSSDVVKFSDKQIFHS